MYLTLVPGQKREKYANLQKLIDGDLLAFVRESPSVARALEEWGMFMKVDSWVPEPLRKVLRTNTPDRSERFRILWRALLNGNPPQVVVMSRSSMLASPDTLAAYNPQGQTITVCKGFIEGWEDSPDHENLRPLTLAVLLHELVHFYNDQVFPGVTVYSAPRPHLEQFGKEAFEPLGWRPIHYIPDDGILELVGAKCV